MGTREVSVSRPDEAELERLGVRDWGVWTSEVATFPWRYDEAETCFLLEGRVRVEGRGEDEGVSAEFGSGDLVTFPRGLECTWIVSEPVRKHFRFGD